MLGNRFTAAIPSSDNPFEMLLGLFKEVIVHTSGDLEEAIEWLKQLDEHYQITSNDYTFDDFIQDLKDKGYIKDDTTGIKIIKGKILIIMLGIIILVKTKGVKILMLIFLKNSTSSNKFKITPKQ